MASTAHNSHRSPAYQVGSKDRLSLARCLDILIAEGLCTIEPSTPFWLALNKLAAEIPGVPTIPHEEYVLMTMVAARTLDGEGFFRKLSATYTASTPTRIVEVVLLVQIDLDLTQIFLERAELSLSNTRYHPVRSDVSSHPRIGGAIDFPATGEGIVEKLRFVVESFQSRQRESQHITHSDVRPGIHLRVDRGQSERDRQSERRESEWARALGGVIQSPLFGHADSRWSGFNELGWDMLDRAEQAESTRRLNEVLAGRKSSIPTACQGCANYYGKTHGGNTLICAMHPHGADSDSCADFEGAASET